MTRPIVLTARMGVLGAFGLFFAVPLVWLLLAPSKTEYDLLTSSPLTFGSFHQIALAWQQLNSFENHAFWTWLGNSLLYSLGGTAIVIATAVPAGYGLALARIPGRRLILTLTLVAMVIPPAALMLPVFLELNAAHLIGSRLSVILPFAFYPFGVYLAYLYYATAVPVELLDAARVDGCGEWQAFRHVALPLAKPAIGFVFFFSFVADWNNYFLPLVVLADSAQYPIQLGLTTLGGRPVLALAVILELIPVATVFAFSQRSLVRGLVSGSLSG